MSTQTWVSIGVGVVAAAVGAFTFGLGTAATLAVFSVAMTATSLIIGQDTPKNGAMRADEIQINQSAEDAVIPVVFGTSRVSANFIFVGFDDYTATDIKQKQSGGKGGGSDYATVGMRYTVPLSYGICMGPIDLLHRVFKSPGLETMAIFEDGLAFTGGHPEFFDILHTIQNGDQQYMEGGSATFYPGSGNQGTATTTDKNHRHVCWVDFPEYTMDGSPAPSSMLFEITRIPRTVDDEGDNIPGFPRRASATDTDTEYQDANPAAVAWEVLQNPLWGKGMTTDKLDAASFVKAAEYYQANKIGMSTVMGKQSITSLMARMREIFGLWTYWDGEKIRARCLYDRTDAYAFRPKIQAEDVIGSPTFTRASLSSTFNEIRLEFTNRTNNWQAEVATAMDLAHVETVGGIRSQSVDAAEIGSRRSAELLAHAMLRQMAYPSASCQLKLRRTYSGLQPGAFVRFVWAEWNEAGMASTFWRVVDIEDDDQASEGVMVTLMEDIYATAQYDDDDGEWEDPSGTIDTDVPLEDVDLVFGDLTTNRDPGTLDPVVLWEPNIFMTRGKRQIAVMPTRQKQFVQGVSVAFSEVGEPTASPLGNSSLMPYNGELLTSIPADGLRLSREAADEFEIEMFTPAHADRFEEATGLVIGPTDHFSALTARNVAILVIGKEVFRIGHAERTTGAIVRIRTFMRGEFGTKLLAHTAGATACFFPAISPTQFLDAHEIPTTSPVNLHLLPIVRSGDTFSEITDVPADLSGYLFGGDSVKPFEPELVAATRVGTTWTVTIRPRLWDAGAGTARKIQEDVATLVSSLAGLSLRFAKGSGSTSATVPAGTSYTTPPFPMPASISVDALTWLPDEGEIGTGQIVAEVTFDANPTTLRIWSVQAGMASVTPLQVPQP